MENKEITSETLQSEHSCTLLTDFTDTTMNQRWRTVNDKVMGGKSEGGAVFQDGTMIFSGRINTNGGGFSSVRFDLQDESLTSFTHLKLKVRTQDFDREYRIIIEDKNRGTVVYRTPLKLKDSPEWQEVLIPFDAFKPSRRGEPISEPAFDKNKAASVGIMLNDTPDGAFKLELDIIEVCEKE